MSQEFDLFANINDLDSEPVNLQDDSPQVPAPVPQELRLDSSNDSHNLSNLSSCFVGNVGSMNKKEQQFMKRYQKKQEVIQRKVERKKQAELRKVSLLNRTTSTPNYKRRSRRRRNPYSPMMDDLSDYIYVGSPDTPTHAAHLEDDELDAISTQSSSISSVELSREVDYEITIKLKWKDQIERIPYTHQQSFQDLFKMLAEREVTTENKIVLMMNDSIIYATDTPSSIGYTSVHFISGRVVDSVLELNKKMKKIKTDIEVKIQSDRWKRPLAVSVPKSETIGKLLQTCAKELNCSIHDINLRFDGEILSEAMTLQDLELEGGEMIDCVFKGGRKK